MKIDKYFDKDKMNSPSIVLLLSLMSWTLFERFQKESVGDKSSKLQFVTGFQIPALIKCLNSSGSLASKAIGREFESPSTTSSDLEESRCLITLWRVMDYNSSNGSLHLIPPSII